MHAQRPRSAPSVDRSPKARREVGKGEHPLPLRPGAWLWATRAGAELDLAEELQMLGRDARPLQDGLVLSAPPAAGCEPAFARQGLPISALCASTVDAVYEALAAALRPRLPAASKGPRSKNSPPPAARPFALHVFSPDSDAGNTLAGAARTLAEALSARAQKDGREILATGTAARDAGGLLCQVCLLSASEAAVGVVSAVHAHSLAPGGRLRTRNSADAPSRSAMKLAEAFLWLGRGPEPEDSCVDLGAAPGGWTRVLIDRGARVVAVDPGQLAPTLRGHRRVRYAQRNAFSYEPDEPADWLLCDMAWRPLEVAALLAKWGRRHWARFLLANIKLPMKQRAAMLVRVREILSTGGWVGLRVRQLYHDREEVTLTAWRGFGVDARPPKKRVPAGADPAPERPKERPRRPLAPQRGAGVDARPPKKRVSTAADPAPARPKERPRRAQAPRRGAGVDARPPKKRVSAAADPVPARPKERPRRVEKLISRPAAGGSRPPAGRPRGGRSGRTGKAR